MDGHMPNNQIDTFQVKQYIFSQDWFSHNIPNLEVIFERFQPTRILEIGSFEGRSKVFFIEKAKQYHENVELYCVDTWQGAREHAHIDMPSVEQCFIHNMESACKHFSNVTVTKHKGLSHQVMMELLVKGYQNYFDFIYVDGSHEAPDVLFDALLAHRLVKVGGVIAFDDYLWSPNKVMEDNHYLLVKPAVDHYVNTYQQKVNVLQLYQIYQLYVQKLAD